MDPPLTTPFLVNPPGDPEAAAALSAYAADPVNKQPLRCEC